MKNSGNSYCLPIEELESFMSGAAMNGQDGIFLYGIAAPSVKKYLPPPLELVDPDNPMFYLYIVNIRQPTFAPWYLEGGIGVMAKCGDKAGLYFFNLQLSGPGALMGAFSGRESSGLPKKLCDNIVVKRTGNQGHCYIERGGVRLVDVELEIGDYNVSEMAFGPEGASDTPGGLVQEGACLLHRYRLDGGFKDLEIVTYDSATRYHTWEPASATVTLNSTLDDPYGEIEVVSVLGAGWSISDNWIKGVTTLYQYPEEEAIEAMRYLLAGRFDRSTFCKGSQIYGNQGG